MSNSVLRGASLLLAAVLPVYVLAQTTDLGDPMVVTGESPEEFITTQLKTPGLGINIDREQIDAINSLNVEDSLRYAPNLIVRKRYIGDANATLSLRGSHTTQTPHALVMVDGFTISDFLGANFDTAPKWALIAPNDVQSVEVVYGPMSARYSGHTLGGAVLMKTRPIETDATRANAQAFQSHYDYYATDLTLDGWAMDAGRDWAFENGGLSFSYRHFENAGQPQQWRRVNADSPFADQAIVDRGLGFPLRIASEDSVVDAREDQFRLRGSWNLGQGWQARGMLGLVRDVDDTTNPRSFLRDENGNETFVGITGVSAGLRERSELLVGLGVTGEIAGWRTDVALSRFDVLKDRSRESDNFNVETGEAPLTGRLRDGADTHWTNLEVVAERSFGAHGLATGLSLSDYGFITRTDSTSDWLRGANPEFRDASGGNTRLLGIFLEDRWRLAPAWTATLGLRAETWEANDGFLSQGDTTVRYAGRDEQALSPKLALAWQPTAGLTVTAAAGLATRFPTVRELYQANLIAFGPNVGELDLNGFDPDLRPEEATDLQLIARQEFDRGFASVSLFRQSLRDAIFQQALVIPPPGNPQGEPIQDTLTTNIDEVQTTGLELWVGTSDFGLPGLSVDMNLALLDAEVTENSLNPELEGNRFPRVPDVRANASIRYSPTPDWFLSLGWRYQDTPDRNIENTANSQCQTFFCVSQFSIVDVRATRQFGGLGVSLGVDNLNDERAFVFHPYPGRTFIAEIRWDGR